MSYDRPYAGLKVLDISQGVAGPACGMLLALHGAEVVKVEPPAGDWSRGLGTRHGDQTALSLAVNRGKRGIALDLKAPAARDVALALADRADLFIESFRPGVAVRLGLGYDVLKVRNRRLLYLSVSGFGQAGPYAARPCTDTVAQAFSGLMSINRGEDGIPHKVGFVVVDMAAAHYAFQAAAAALYARDREGEGRHIDVSLMQAVAATMATKVVEAHLESGEPPLLNMPAGSYRTRDGWIAITLVREEQFRRLCAALGRPALADESRFVSFQSRAANSGALLAILRELLAGRDTADWVERLTAHDVICNPIHGFGDWLEDPHVRAVEAAPLVAQPGIGPVPAPAIPGLPPVPADDARQIAPGLGEHGRSILEGLGYGEAAIARLAAEGAVRLQEARRQEAAP